MTPRSTPSIPVGPGTRWDCIHPEEARRTNVIEEPTIYEVCSRCEAVLAIRQEARPTPVEPEAPEPLVIEPWRELLEAWLHSGGMDRDELGRLITSTERSLGQSEVGYHAIDPEVEPDGLPLDVPRLADALRNLGWPPTTTLQLITEREDIAAEYARLSGAPSEDEQPR